VKTLRFTPTEREVLSHRLRAAEAIAEALTADGDYPFSEDEVYATAVALAHDLESGTVTFDPEDRLSVDVLVDAVDGSNFPDLILDRAVTTPKQAPSLRKALRSIEAKFEEAGLPALFQ
jgi:hypothetical protein